MRIALDGVVETTALQWRDAMMFIIKFLMEGGEMMKRRNLTLVAILLFVLSVQAQAALYANRASVELSFDGTTAYCSGQVRSGNANSAIEATLTLWDGNTVVNSWSRSGKGSVNLSGSCTVSKGKRYTLTIDATVNGVPISQESTSKTC